MFRVPETSEMCDTEADRLRNRVMVPRAAGFSFSILVYNDPSPPDGDVFCVQVHG
jgi:hypothetical protein